ncbi:hypothetical protein llap_19492 [Limosa lapponica baueri]|uniref:Uncharacterized protein n=1 Tax=Limosa lapponica baueri TaxID=1758121 RepID=A0A2I0T8T9_LIMLA|nr:hypothetical protein llap_19492 [Limosa lapponica baueri]
MRTLNNSGDQTDCLRLGLAQLRNGQWCSEPMSEQAMVTMLTGVRDSTVRQMCSQWEHHASDGGQSTHKTCVKCSLGDKVVVETYNRSKNPSASSSSTW